MQFINDTVLQDEIKCEPDLWIHLTELYDPGVLGTAKFVNS